MNVLYLAENHIFILISNLYYLQYHLWLTCIIHWKSQNKELYYKFNFFLHRIIKKQRNLNVLSNFLTKNPAYGRQSISRPMRIVAPCWWFGLACCDFEAKRKQKLNISGDLSFLKGTFSTDGHDMTEVDYNMY